MKKEIEHDKIKTRTLEASTEIGASNWLTTLPLKEKGFLLDKQSFWDSLFLRYSIPLPRLPSKCVCGKPFIVDHALSCCRGGFISTEHNELRDFTAELVSECCKDVSVEPTLQAQTGEKFPQSTIKSDEARVDVAARGFLVKGQMAFFDIRVFNPTAKTYLVQNLNNAHKRNEQEKKRNYNQRILTVDQGSFTPLVFSCLGGMGREAGVFYKRLAENIAAKRNIPTSTMINWIRTRVNYHLIRSCLLCLRGSISWKTVFETVRDTDVNLVNFECNMPKNCITKKRIFIFYCINCSCRPSRITSGDSLYQL